MKRRKRRRMKKKRKKKWRESGRGNNQIAFDFYDE